MNSSPSGKVSSDSLSGKVSSDILQARCSFNSLAKEKKGAWRMPWLTEAMKDVISCDKPGVGANNL